MDDVYKLLPPGECYSKTHGDYLETYESHVNASVAFVKPVMNMLKSKYSFEYVEVMVEIHDIGKRGIEFQDKIKGSKSQQYIRHEYLAFIKWLEGDPEINRENPLTSWATIEGQKIFLPQILAILMHHQTIIDDDISAVMIERYIAEHTRMEALSKIWLSILKTPREKKIDKTFLEALKLVDILRTIDILASYTTETVFARYFDKNYAKNSLYEAGITDLSKELSTVNLKSSEIEFEKVYSDDSDIKIHILKPIDCFVKYVKRGTK